MKSSSKQPKAWVPLLVCALALSILAVSNGVTAALVAGCGTPQFDGNPVNFGVGTGPRSIVVRDFNHDGKNDLAVADYGSELGSPTGAISILLNNGSGGFSSATNIAAGINPRSIVSADFNGDSNPDLAVLNYLNGSCCNHSFVTIFLGNGAGNFAMVPSPIEVGSDAFALAAGDFNKDGHADLAATVQVSSSRFVSILLGNGSAGFSTPVNYPAGGGANSIATGDFNGDTNLDFVTANVNGFNISVLLGDGLGGFGAPANYPVAGANPQFVAVGDFNQDSKLDVVTANTFNNVTVVLGNGNGTFGAGTLFPVASAPQSVLAQDLSGDGKLDLVTANSGSSSVSVLIGDGAGGFGSLATYSANSGSFFVAASDFNGDAKVDLAVANFSSNNVTILPGNDSGGFAGARMFNVGLVPFGPASGDFNNDSKLDLVVANTAQNSVSVLLGDGNGSFGADVKYPSGFSPRDVVVADFNDDAKLDFGVANGTCCANPDSVSILLGNGNGTFAAPTTFAADTNAFAIVSADFNKDGKPDLATVNNADSDVSILIGAGDGSFAAPANISVSFSPVDLATADVNGDGNTDLIVASNNQLSVLLGNGVGGFSSGTPIVVPGPVSVAVGDVNGDGFADLATANSVGSLSVILGDGSGSFGPRADLPLTSAASVAIADVNGDGKADLAVTTGSSSGSVVLFIGNGSGGFDSGTPFNAGAGPRGILPIDVNTDGRTDLVVTSSNNFLAVLMNSCLAAPAVPPGLSVSDAMLAEGNSGQTNAVFEVFLSASSDKTVTVSYYSSNQSATAGVDYQPVSGHVTFPPGVTEQTFSVPINGDTAVEPNETFVVNLSSPVNAGIADAQGMATIVDDDNTLQFGSASYFFNEAVGSGAVTVTRSAGASNAATVDYATSDSAGSSTCININGRASSRCDYETTTGTLHFAAGETSKTISIPIINDSYLEGGELFMVSLSNPNGATLSSPTLATINIVDNDSVNGPNPIDQAEFFVRQHYIDFLNREPDPAGLQFWTNQITECQQPGATCSAEVRRINVSAAFFLSIEFQETGFLVYRFYKSAYGNIVGTPVPIRLFEFLPDTQQVGRGVVIGQPGAEQLLEANKVAYALDFVSRSRFTTAYPTTLTPAQFVDALFANAGVTPSTSDRDAAINEFGGAGNTADTSARARALRRVAENSTLRTQETNKAFVLMQYFGYLRRNPNDPPEANLDFGGYNFWLNKLNEFNGNFVNADMVKAFIVSGEYRHRFGP